jgi:tRNA-dihydrouridine synthase A
VARLKVRRPDLVIVLNGGLRDAMALASHLISTDGVMLGRLAYQEPWQLALAQSHLFGTPLPDRRAVLEDMTRYAADQVATGVPLRAVARHMLGLFNGEPGARRFRRRLGAIAGDDPPGTLLAAAPAANALATSML